MRIVGGKFGGRRLAGPKSNTNRGLIRPTSDRNRESLFNILAARMDVTGKRVIDLFAGTGALGLEALSRGASYALFVDNSTEGRALLRTNIEQLGLQGCTRIFRRDATRPGPCGNMPPFDLAFLDPPYAKGLGERALAALRDGGWLADDALVILEENTAAMPGSFDGYDVLDLRTRGETSIAVLSPSETLHR